MLRFKTRDQRIADEQLTRRLVSDTSSNFSSMLSQQAALAKAELGQSAAKGGLGIAALVVACAGLVFALFFLSLGAWWGLGLLIGNALSGLAIGVLWLLLVAAFVIVAIKFFKKVEGAPRTVATLKQWPAMLRGQAQEFIPGVFLKDAGDDADAQKADAKAQAEAKAKAEAKRRAEDVAEAEASARAEAKARVANATKAGKRQTDEEDDDEDIK